MEALPKISPEGLKTFLHNCVDQFAEKLVETVNSAESGRLIADSEEGARELITAFGRAAYEAALQERIDAAEASFPPSRGNSDRSSGPATGPEAFSE